MKDKILIISASSNFHGNSVQLAKWLIQDANLNKHEFEWIYLYKLNIPHLTNENRKADIKDGEENRDISDLIKKIKNTDNIIITTPVWNFATPATLKNLIDRSLFSGRVWSEEKNKKIPGWGGKKFYLLFSMGAPWLLVLPDFLAIAQLYLTLRYYGGKPKIVRYTTNCGNGSKLIINDRFRLKKCLRKKGKKYFK